MWNAILHQKYNLYSSFTLGYVQYLNDEIRLVHILLALSRLTYTISLALLQRQRRVISISFIIHLNKFEAIVNVWLCYFSFR